MTIVLVSVSLPGVKRRLVVAFVTGSLVAGALCGCSRTGTAAARDGRLGVEASFYPLQWMAQQVGGRFVDVANLTEAGAEPHDLELTPHDVGALEDADVVVYLSGFQPSVDDAVRDVARSSGFDVRGAAALDLELPAEIGKGNGRQSKSDDPHFWLDPTRLATVARSLARVLARRDPAHASAYSTNAAAVGAKLGALDHAFASALRRCRARDLVTTHAAFGYLARRYGLRQVAISGITPEDEPAPRSLAAVADLARRRHVRTIYFETLISPAIAHTVAAETGTRTAVLDPIEGLSNRSEGSDYLSIMGANLVNLRRGQPCP